MIVAVIAHKINDINENGVFGRDTWSDRPAGTRVLHHQTPIPRRILLGRLTLAGSPSWSPTSVSTLVARL